ncbi:MAG: putative selenium-dependent hydroxylase accessory protein YqeC [bacterium]|nr:putative selenium-dependent hydroxylase accessory protein YqeC [bacterium]
MSSITTLLGCKPDEFRGKVIAVMGSGGKTSLLSCLAEEFAAVFPRVLISTSTKVYPFPGVPFADSLAALPDHFAKNRIVFIGRKIAESGKLGGPPTLRLDELRPHADVILLETDGARRHPLKVHLPHDPVVPDGVDLAFMVVGASALGRPLDSETLHRAQWIPPHWGLKMGEEITAELIARILTAPDGYLGKAGRAPLRVLVNQADEHPAAANDIAAALVARWPGTVFTGAAFSGRFRQMDRQDTCPSLVLLAAGSSQRFGNLDKRSTLLHGYPMLTWSMRAYAKARVFERLLVLGPGDQRYFETALQFGFRPVICMTAAQGMGESLVAALSAINASADSLLIGLGDKPALRQETVAQILCDTQCYPGRVLRPVYNDQPGHPVFLPRSAFGALAQIKGDTGGRDVLASLDPLNMEFNDPGIVIDVDHPDQVGPAEACLERGFDLDVF